MIFYKVNKKDIGNLRIFLNSMKLEKMDILETKNSLSLKLTDYFTIKNEKILSISIALECFFQIAVSSFELLYRGVLQDVSLVDEDDTRA